jgi:hypothetical protein
MAPYCTSSSGDSGDQSSIHSGITTLASQTETETLSSVDSVMVPEVSDKLDNLFEDLDTLAQLETSASDTETDPFSKSGDLTINALSSAASTPPTLS